MKILEILSKYISKKYTFAAGTIASEIVCLYLGVKASHEHQWMVVAALVCITVICVTYLTGQAKIDLELQTNLKPSDVFKA